MKRLSNDPIPGRRERWLGIDMFEPDFGQTRESLAMRVPEIKVLTARRLFIQVANNIPPGPDGISGETQRECAKALDVLEVGEDQNTPYTDLEDARFNIILAGVEKVLPSHPLYGIHYSTIVDKIKEDAEVPVE